MLDLERVRPGPPDKGISRPHLLFTENETYLRTYIHPPAKLAALAVCGTTAQPKLSSRSSTPAKKPLQHPSDHHSKLVLRKWPTLTVSSIPKLPVEQMQVLQNFGGCEKIGRMPQEKYTGHALHALAKRRLQPVTIQPGKKNHDHPFLVFRFMLMLFV
ncbi:hypothetical protein [Pseudomonas viridiflava]|uniref:hypothetical protein n=1 Tax=Pseudomonas viridiflava TaxID=33069 RepID=UPI001C312637|nr:hypothetical protein [Pseudomonas viridiflava]QXG29549.1 hypothetical protein KTT59_21615 [Pseudomonas viridiflava]